MESGAIYPQNCKINPIVVKSNLDSICNRLLFTAEGIFNPKPDRRWTKWFQKMMQLESPTRWSKRVAYPNSLDSEWRTLEHLVRDMPACQNVKIFSILRRPKTPIQHEKSREGQVFFRLINNIQNTTTAENGVECQNSAILSLVLEEGLLRIITICQKKMVEQAKTYELKLHWID